MHGHHTLARARWVGAQRTTFSMSWLQSLKLVWPENCIFLSRTLRLFPLSVQITTRNKAACRVVGDSAVGTNYKFVCPTWLAAQMYRSALFYEHPDWLFLSWIRMAVVCLDELPDSFSSAWTHKQSQQLITAMELQVEGCRKLVADSRALLQPFDQWARRLPVTAAPLFVKVYLYGHLYPGCWQYVTRESSVLPPARKCRAWANL